MVKCKLFVAMKYDVCAKSLLAVKFKQKHKSKMKSTKKRLQFEPTLTSNKLAAFHDRSVRMFDRNVESERLKHDVFVDDQFVRLSSILLIRKRERKKSE